VTGLIEKPGNFATVSASIRACAFAEVVKIPATTSQSVEVCEMTVVVVDVVVSGTVVAGVICVVVVAMSVGGTKIVVVVVAFDNELPLLLQPTATNTSGIRLNTNLFVFGTATPSSGSGGIPTLRWGES
jgi:hypothetical protein